MCLCDDVIRYDAVSNSLMRGACEYDTTQVHDIKQTDMRT
jgi:hypothetical protein